MYFGYMNPSTNFYLEKGGTTETSKPDYVCPKSNQQLQVLNKSSVTTQLSVFCLYQRCIHLILLLVANKVYLFYIMNIKLLLSCIYSEAIKDTSKCKECHNSTEDIIFICKLVSPFSLINTQFCSKSDVLFPFLFI